MISGKIKAEIERSAVITSIAGVKGGAGWGSFTRTIFERIARRINQEVTKKAIESPDLVRDFLLIGEQEFAKMLFTYKLSGMDDFLAHLSKTSTQKPYRWISGKTLQSYWNNGSAKDKKLNVLLTFLGVNLSDWDNWKLPQAEQPVMSPPDNTLRLLQRHFIGCYYRYYQKTDSSNVLIKTPFVIREDRNDLVVVETKTLGHQYKSTAMTIRNGALYIECENLNWDEKESFIFNVGFEPNPEVLTGVSNTLNRRGQAIAIKNVLVKQSHPFDYATEAGVEISFHQHFDAGSEEACVVPFFRNSPRNIICTPYCYTLGELASAVGEKTENKTPV